jgi:hypothetical protein
LKFFDVCASTVYLLILRRATFETQELENIQLMKSSDEIDEKVIEMFSLTSENTFWS